ncbi:MAG: hypothetical protein WD119_00010 [Pirellulaceae bacterium]
MPSTYASRPPSIFYGLVWKESMQLLPLLLAFLGLSTLLMAVLGLIPNGYRAFPTFLILIPNIFAIGAPPMAIGQEDETGTLRWMRGLPVDWWSIALVKFMVALLGLILIWIFLIAVMALAGVPKVFGGREVFSVEAIGGIGFAGMFSVYLMSGGFAVSWWLRSPIPSLLTMLPLITLLFVAVMQIATRFDAPNRSAPIVHTVVLCIATLALLAIAAAGARRTFYRSWTRRRSRRWIAIDAAIKHAYQPTYIVPLHSPGRRFALLWQAAAQTWLVVLPIFCVGFIAALIPLVIFFANPQGGLPIGPLMIGLAVTPFLGAMVFAADNKNRRHRFLADRGIGSFTIWWTRQALPLLATVVLAGTFFVVYYAARDNPARVTGLTGLQTLLLFALAFASGQLTGQAFRRPIMGVLAAPVVFVAFSVFAVAVLIEYPSYTWAGIAAVALLWLVTLRLCRRWSDERFGAGYYGRLAGWIALAVLVFVGPIAISRYVTTPPAVPDRHAETLALAERLREMAERKVGQDLS